MVDVQKLREAIRNFKFWASPSGSANTPATVGDINNLISQIEKVLTAFVDELED